MSRRRLWMAVAVATVGLVSLGQGGWIYAKALAAQALLDRAWTRTLAGEARVPPWPWADTWPVARLEAPAHDAEMIVLAGSTGAVLAFGPGHLEGSAEPGAHGNCVLSGHRDTHFRFLSRLERGDEIRLSTPDGASYRYRVESLRVVDETDLSVLEPGDEVALTLVTCYPFDTIAPGGPLRYVVRAVRGPGRRGPAYS